MKMFGFKADRRGVTALEYGMIAGLIVATIALGFGFLANNLSSQFTNDATCLQDGTNYPTSSGG